MSYQLWKEKCLWRTIYLKLQDSYSYSDIVIECKTEVWKISILGLINVKNYGFQISNIVFHCIQDSRYIIGVSMMLTFLVIDTISCIIASNI